MRNQVRCWFNLLATARPHPKNTAHSPSRPRYTRAHLPAQIPLGATEAGSDANERTIGQSFEHDFAGQAPIDPTLEPARQSASNPIAAINPNVNFIVGSLPTAPISSQVRTGLTAGGKWIRTVGPTCGRGSLCRERDGNNGSSTDPARDCRSAYRDCRSAYRDILTNVSPIAASI